MEVTRDWVPLHWRFTASTGGLVRDLMPGVEVHRRATITHIQWAPHADRVALSLRVDSVDTPLLAPPALVAFLCVEWPQWFRLVEAPQS